MTQVLDAKEVLERLESRADDIIKGCYESWKQAEGKERDELKSNLEEMREEQKALTAQIRAMDKTRSKTAGLEIMDPAKLYTPKASREVFSLFRYAIASVAVKSNGHVAGAPMSAAQRLDCGLEMEVMNSLNDPERLMESAQNVGAGADGGVFMPHEMSTAIIPELVARSAAGTFGVTRVTGLQGTMSWPKKLSGVVGSSFDTENQVDQPPREQLKFAVVSGQPRPFGVTTEITYQGARQLAISMESMVREDFVEKLALLQDLHIFKGSGQDNQPLGAFHANRTKVRTVDWTGTNFGTDSGGTQLDGSNAKAREHYHLLRRSNALGDGSSLRWVMEPDSMYNFEVAQDKDGRPFYIDRNNAAIDRLLGYQIAHSTQLGNPDSSTASFIGFGNGRAIIHAQWNSLAIDATDSHGTNFPTGLILLRAIGEHDVVVRHEEALTRGVNFASTAPAAA